MPEHTGCGHAGRWADSPGHGASRSNGEIVIARADPDAMERPARANGGDSHELTLGDADIRALALNRERKRMVGNR